MTDSAQPPFPSAHQQEGAHGEYLVVDPHHVHTESYAALRSTRGAGKRGRGSRAMSLSTCLDARGGHVTVVLEDDELGAGTSVDTRQCSRIGMTRGGGPGRPRQDGHKSTERRPVGRVRVRTPTTTGVVCFNAGSMAPGKTRDGSQCLLSRARSALLGYGVAPPSSLRPRCLAPIGRRSVGLRTEPQARRSRAPSSR